VCCGLTSALPPPSLSALFPATAARQGGWVAASLVDASEFRTADERRYCSQIYITLEFIPYNQNLNPKLPLSAFICVYLRLIMKLK